MDEWLAQIYGTNGGGEDLEKTAQAVMLNKLAEEEGLDLSGLDEEQLEALAQELLSADGAEDQETEVEEVEQPETDVQDEQTIAKEAEAKFAEADFLGRVMAHAFHQESQAIEKTAGDMKNLGKALKSVGNYGAGKGLRARLHQMGGKAKLYGAAAKFHGGKAVKRVGEEVKKHPGAAAGAAGAVGAGAGFMAGRKSAKSKTKTASAFDTLAEQRAIEILNERNATAESNEKVADPTEAFNQALETRAMEMLAEAGYGEEE